MNKIDPIYYPPPKWISVWVNRRLKAKLGWENELARLMVKPDLEKSKTHDSKSISEKIKK